MFKATHNEIVNSTTTDLQCIASPSFDNSYKWIRKVGTVNEKSARVKRKKI